MAISAILELFIVYSKYGDALDTRVHMAINVSSVFVVVENNSNRIAEGINLKK